MELGSQLLLRSPHSALLQSRLEQRTICERFNNTTATGRDHEGQALKLPLHWNSFRCRTVAPTTDADFVG